LETYVVVTVGIAAIKILQTVKNMFRENIHIAQMFSVGS
jgi:hypothetical protein